MMSKIIIIITSGDSPPSIYSKQCIYSALQCRLHWRFHSHNLQALAWDPVAETWSEVGKVSSGAGWQATKMIMIIMVILMMMMVMTYARNMNMNTEQAVTAVSLASMEEFCSVETIHKRWRTNIFSFFLKSAFFIKTLHYNNKISLIWWHCQPLKKWNCINWFELYVVVFNCCAR